jgi:hypothetical protein
MAANSICHAATQAGQVWQEAAWETQRPSVLFRPRLFIDGNYWCALFGENLQDGVGAFGESPDAAMRAFDDMWRAALPANRGDVK